MNTNLLGENNECENVEQLIDWKRFEESNKRGPTDGNRSLFWQGNCKFLAGGRELHEPEQKIRLD